MSRFQHKVFVSSFVSIFHAGKQVKWLLWLIRDLIIEEATFLTIGSSFDLKHGKNWRKIVFT